MMKNLSKLLLFISIPTLIMSCSDDDDSFDDPIFEGESVTYDLRSVADPSISGEATFVEQEDGSTIIELNIMGTPDGGMHPAHIHENTAAEGGDIAISLDPVDGSTGMSTTIVSADDNGNAVTFEELTSYDGYINVHLSAEELDTIVAQGDIGENVLTGESLSYDLDERAVEGISGTVMFEERMNGEALATIMLDGTPAGGMHPAHIHMNTAAESGAIAFTFNPVDGDTGMSMTNVSELDDEETAFMYSDIMDYDGYVNVHLNATDLGTIVAQGDIGQNALTGESLTYTLNEVDIAGISGTVMFEERMNGEALATIMLDGTPAGGEHPAHIHMGAVGDSGAIAFSFNPVDGDTGMSMTNVSEFDDDTAFMYSDIMDYDGYVNVHASATDLATLAAQGNIGANAQ
ncbi:CHRD domain-containing protein [Mesonia mobilis]|uniref:CHRD domain-containing protein n=1 Tax=Mesonia mobilis TaxID=369791 RepID=UPI0026EC4490|nr:CHRD domain-containing protein [Mesonia mobilis]